MRASLPMGRTLSPALGCALLGREMARCVIMYVSGTGATGLSGESRKACDWKTDDKKTPDIPPSSDNYFQALLCIGILWDAG